MQKAPTLMKISSFRIDSVDVEFNSHWLSWRGGSLGVDLVDREWDFNGITTERKKFEKVGEFKNNIEDTLKPYYLAYIFLISAKNQSKKISHASVPLGRKMLQKILK